MEQLGSEAVITDEKVNKKYLKFISLQFYVLFTHYITNILYLQTFYIYKI